MAAPKEMIDSILKTFSLLNHLLGRKLTTDERTIYFLGRIDGLMVAVKCQKCSQAKHERAKVKR